MNNPSWEAWFDAQYELCATIDGMLNEISKGRSPNFRLALMLAVQEHLAEDARRYVHLLETDSGDLRRAN